jgi:hypothetical protein
MEIPKDVLSGLLNEPLIQGQPALQHLVKQRLNTDPPKQEPSSDEKARAAEDIAQIYGNLIVPSPVFGPARDKKD